MATTDPEIRMWAMDRALDSFKRNCWEDNFLRAVVLFEWAKNGTAPPFNGEGEVDFVKFFGAEKDEGGQDG